MGKKLNKVVTGAALAGVIVSGAGAGFAPGEVDAASKTTKSSIEAKKKADAAKKKAAEVKKKADAAKKKIADAKKKAEAAKKAAEAKKKAEIEKAKAEAKKKADALAKKIAEAKKAAEEAKKKAAEAKAKAEAAKKAAEAKVVATFKTKTLDKLDEMNEGIDMLIEENGYSLEYLDDAIVSEAMSAERAGLQAEFGKIDVALKGIQSKSNELKKAVSGAKTIADVAKLEVAVVKLDVETDKVTEARDALVEKSNTFMDKILEVKEEAMFNFQMKHFEEYNAFFGKLAGSDVGVKVQTKLDAMQKALFDAGKTYKEIKPIYNTLNERIFTSFNPFGDSEAKMDELEQAILDGDDEKALALMNEITGILDSNRDELFERVDALIEKTLLDNGVTIAPVEEGTGEEGTGDTGTGDEGTGNGDVVVTDPTDEGTGDTGTGDTGTSDEVVVTDPADEGTGDTGTGDEVVVTDPADEGTGDEVVVTDPTDGGTDTGSEEVTTP